jgi:hypothetical protein
MNRITKDNVVDPLMTARMEFPLWIFEQYNYKMK